MMDTDAAGLAQYFDLIRSIPRPQRLAHALALSALVRAMAWQGAVRHSAHAGDLAVAERFLLQLYGPDVARRTAALLRAPANVGDAT